MAYNLTLNENASFDNGGRFGQSLIGFGSCPVLALPSSGEMAINVFVKTTAEGLSVAFGTTNGHIWIGKSGTGAACSYGANEVQFFTSVGIADGNWHLLTLNLDSLGAKFFVDGVLAASDPRTFNGQGGSVSSGTIGIGAFGTYNSYPWQGTVDEVSIYSGGKYTANFTPPTAPTPNDDENLNAVWHFDGDGVDSKIAGVPDNVITPDNVNLVYSPYNWDITETSAKTINAGAYFKCMFTGSSAKLNFDLTEAVAPYAQIWYRIDGSGAWVKEIIAPELVLTMNQDSQMWTTHFLEVVIKCLGSINGRWNTDESSVILSSITLSENGRIFPFIKSNLNVICYADSIGEGVNVYKAYTNSYETSDAMIGLTNQLCGNLSCEVGNVSYGGIAFSHGGDGGVPKLYDSYNKLHAGKARSFEVVPNVVISLVGVNDEGAVTSDILLFINAILADTPATTKLIMVQPIYSNPNIQDAIAQCSSPERCIYIPTSGFWKPVDSPDNIHPYGYMLITQLAPYLANEIRKYLYPIDGNQPPSSGGTAADFWNYLTSNPVVPGSMMERILNSASADFVGEIMANN